MPSRAAFLEILLKVRRERSDSSIYRADPEGLIKRDSLLAVSVIPYE